MKEILAGLFLSYFSGHVNHTVVDPIKQHNFRANIEYKSIHFDLKNAPSRLDSKEITQINDIVKRFRTTAIIFTNAFHIRTIEQGFLENCTSLREVDLSAFENVELVRSGFLKNCTSLRSIELPYFFTTQDAVYDTNAECANINFSLRNSQKILVNLAIKKITAIVKKYKATSVDFKDAYHVIAIEEKFLEGCSSLEKLDLSALQNVTSIGNEFLRGSGIRSIDLSALENVMEIGSSFLQGCALLNFAEIFALNKRIIISDNFLSECSSLKELKLPSFPNIQYIPSSFLANFLSSTSLDLSFWKGRHINHIGSNFLRGCSSLTSLDLSSLMICCKIEKCFLEGCLSLTSLDLGHLENVKCIESDFLRGCSSLTSLNLRYLKNVEHIKNGFLSGCSSLTSLDLGTLQIVENTSGFVFTYGEIEQTLRIENDFLRGCSSLTSLDLRSLQKINSFGKYFLADCSSLTSLNLEYLENVPYIENDFLCGCSSLTSLNLNFLRRVKKIGSCFLANCSSLTSLKLESLDKFFEPLENVEHIENDFLRGCSALKSLDLSSLRVVKKIENYFLANCSSLTSVNFPLFNHLNDLGDEFLGSTHLPIPNCIKIFISAKEKARELFTPVKYAFSGPTQSDIIEQIGVKFSLPVESVRKLSAELNGSFIKIYIDTAFKQKEECVDKAILIDFGLIYSLKESEMKCMNSITDLIQPTSIRFISAYHVKSIPYGFLSNCTSLKELNLSSFVDLETIGDYFLSKCTSLISIIFPNCKITYVGHNFLLFCESLVSVDLSILASLNEIGHYEIEPNKFLWQFMSRKIVHNFLMGTDSLQTIFVNSEENLKKVKFIISKLLNKKFKYEISTPCCGS